MNQAMNFAPQAVEIRPLEAQDFEQILSVAEMVEEAPRWSRAQYEDLLPGPHVFPEQSRRARIALIAHDARTGEILGFAVAGLLPPEAELESIAVSENARRRSIGRRLLATLVTSLRAEGITALHLEVRASNAAAIRFYLAQNFNQSGVRPRYYSDPEEDAVLMTLRLA
jgi:[ribosomal protein S18]-alanine N-acetyltransferase